MMYIHHMATTDASRALEGLFELAELLGESMQRELDTRGLTRARAEVVWRLGLDGTMTQKDLSQALRCTPRNVTGLIDALEDSGLVVRRPHPEDRRATLVGLTTRGKRASAAWAEGYTKLANTLFADINSAELATFVRTLDRVRGRLRRVPPRRRSRSPSAA
jgi:DNA-binding MarR family transcriptional regulator